MPYNILGTNIIAMGGIRKMSTVGKTKLKAGERISTGKKINSASDDAAGLAISKRMKSIVKGLDMANKNIDDGISLVEVADGALSEVDNILNKVREISVACLNDTYTDDDRETAQKEVSNLLDELDQISNTNFNGIKLFQGDETSNGSIDSMASKLVKPIYVQNGANDEELMELELGNITSNALGINNLSVSTYTSADNALKNVDNALDYVGDLRSSLGSYKNRLNATKNYIGVYSCNTSDAESRIQDGDMAREVMNLVSSNVLEEAAKSMVAQSNQSPESILKLLS